MLTDAEAMTTFFVLDVKMILMRCCQSSVHQHGVVVVNHGVILAVQQEYRCLDPFRMYF